MEGKCFDVGMCHMSACPCRAAELKYGTLMSLQKQLLDAEEALKRRAGAAAAGRLLKEEVTEADIAEIISKWTGTGGRVCLQGAQAYISGAAVLTVG
jgi:ATP-dependent Clp protease ATP-binding subunit ClpA